MIIDFKLLRPTHTYPPYPPYHTGLYLEEYFFEYYKRNKVSFDDTNRTLIPIFWTNLYMANYTNNKIQQYIDLLPTDKKYFTISQFDDGISQKLPEDTINFVAGGNMQGIPIPLICSPIPEKYISKENKDIYCSFVGTYVNSEKYECRNKLYTNFSNSSKYYFSKPRHWDRVVSADSFNEFLNITKRSTFTLCPRGYGKQSFRLYEAIQLNSIPVFVYDETFLPFETYIDWKSFCVLVNKNDIESLDNILHTFSEDRIQEMLISGKKIYNEFFTLEGVSNTILKYLVNI